MASSDDGPRADKSFPPEKRDAYENLLVLCGVCHDKVDGQPNTYDIAFLKDKKRAHEHWVSETLGNELLDISFSELDILLKKLAAKDNAELITNFELTTPPEKIKKNELSPDVMKYLLMGMLRERDVASFISDATKLDPEFSKRLIGRIKLQYKALTEKGLKGDDLFHALHNFILMGNRDLKTQATALAILTHFFVICEVFEP